MAPTAIPDSWGWLRSIVVVQEELLRSRVAELVRQDLDHTSLSRELDAVLRPGLGYDMAAWSTVDPATMLSTSCVLGGDAEVDHDRELRTFQLEWEGTDPNTYVEIAERSIPAAALSEVGDLASVRRYTETMEPMGITDELRVVLRAPSGVWGALTAFRADGSPPYTSEEVERAARVCVPVAEGLRRAFLRTALEGAGRVEDPPGELVVDRQGRMVTTSEAAERLLDTVREPGQVPSVVRQLVARLAHDPAPTATLAGTAGPLAFHAMEVKGGADQVAVVVERPRPVVLADLIMRAHGLSDRERQVTEGVMWGRSTAQLASDLGISAYTVQDHLKSIFAKVGVVTRGELIAAIYTRHYLPRRQRGAQPGPYGYFLD